MPPEVLGESAPQALPRSISLINRTQLKRFILEQAKVHRAHKWTRVSASFLDSCEAVLRSSVIGKIKQLPSKGKTIDI